MEAAVCVLPVIPLSLPGPADDKSTENARQLAGQALAATALRIRTDVATSAELGELLRATAAAVRSAAVLQAESGEGPAAPPTDADARTALEEGLTADVVRLPGEEARSRLVEVTLRYDAFFGLRRSPGAEPAAKQSQLLRTSIAVLDDLAICMIDLHHIRTMLDGVVAALGWPAAEPVRPELPAGAATTGTAPPTAQEVAMRRWRYGHHLFALLVSTAAATVRDALELVEDTDEDGAVRALERAETLLRGSTACMWYAASFPTRIYEDLVRPAMAAASPTGGGFSGIDNFDYRVFRQSVDDLWRRIARDCDGPPVGERTRLAAYRLFEARQSELESHTLIADKVVGTQPSLRQLRELTRVDSDGPAHPPTAVDTLRALGRTCQRQKERLLA